MIDLKNLVSLPTYTTEVPSTKQQVKYRPFVVKEEKVLLLALESKDQEKITNAFKSILDSCYFGKINADELPYYDSEYLFIQLRMRSMGEAVEITIRDPVTNERFETTLDLNKIKVINIPNSKDDLNIKLNENIGVTLKYPNSETFSKIFKQDTGQADVMFELLTKSIDKIYTKDEVMDAKDKPEQEIKDFIENLPIDMFSKLLKLFENMPLVIYEDEFISPTTGNTIPIIIKDFSTFFD